MPKITFTVESPLPPERIVEAATDFSDRRPDLWPNISRRYYQVHERGDTWAEVTEGSDTMGGVWARERYDWSTPGVVRATVLESNVFSGGIWEMRVEPSPSGGSRINVVSHRQPKGRGRVAAVFMTLGGKRFLTKSLQKTLAILERHRAEASSAAATT
jgi:hypothetical protein